MDKVLVTGADGFIGSHLTEMLLLVGGGGHCKSVIDAAESSGWTILGILDVAENAGKKVLGYLPMY